MDGRQIDKYDAYFSTGKEILRAFLMYVAFLVITSVMSAYFVLGGAEITREFSSGGIIVGGLSSLSLIFASYSVFRAFELYDLEARRAYLHGNNGKYSLAYDLKKIFTDKTLLTKLVFQVLTVYFLVIILPYHLGFYHLITTIFPEESTVGGFTRHLVKIGISIPSLSLIMLLAKTSAHKWWVIARTSEQEKMNRMKSPNLRLLLETVKIFFIYSIGFAVLPTVLLLLLSLLLMAELFKTQPWILLILAILFIFIASIRAIITLISRRSFYKKLKKTLADEGYALTDVYRPILSSIFIRGGSNFKIEKNGRVYECKLITSGRRRLPLYVNPEGFFTVKRTVSFLKITLFHIMKDTDYCFDSPHTKIVVFSPMPRRVYINYGRTDTAPDDGDGGTLPTTALLRTAIRGGGKSASRSVHGPGYISDVDRGIIKPFETGEKIGEYKFFTPEGFISAVDNDCLDR